jgi:ribonuclease P protein component
MFPREQRLRRSSDVITTLRKGKRFSCGPLTCSFIPKPDKLSRVTVVVDTKVSKLAVVRNLVKRRIRSALHNHTLPAGDLVIRAYPAVVVLPYSQINYLVEQCLKRLS